MNTAFTIRNLEKKYPGFTLGPLNLDLQPGMVQGLIGHNGAGKTTTILCMTGLTRFEKGSIEIFGNKVDLNDAAWKFDIGYVGDEPAFYENWSGAKNLKFISQFYPAWSDMRAQELANRFELDLNAKAKTLSRGNRVKLALIAAMAHNPKLYLFDEPTAGLDPVVRAEVMEELWKVMRDGEHAILYSTHILPDINRLADELVFLNRGQLLLRTPKDDLLEKWRRLTFKWCQTSRLTPEVTDRNVCPTSNAFEGVVKLQRQGDEYEMITADVGKSLPELEKAGIKPIQQSRLSIDEIAVEIMKGGSHVAAH